MVTDELLAHIFAGKPNLLVRPMVEWLTSSRQFTAFATTFRDKIRKKVRTTQDREGLLDLQLELETAYLLLQEKKLSLVYELLQPGQSRCPDFAVSFTTSYTFMVEVTRLRAEQNSHDEGVAAASTTPLIDERLADTICSKLGQLLPQHSNVLVVGVEKLSLTNDDLKTMMLRIKQRAEQGDAVFLKRYRLRDRSEFFRIYQRLSEILVRGVDWQVDQRTAVWVNPQAKHPLPNKVRTSLYQSHAI